MVTQQQYDEAVSNLTDRIIKAAKDINNNPEKAEKFIRDNTNNIYKCGMEIGKLSVTRELFFEG